MGTDGWAIYEHQEHRQSLVPRVRIVPTGDLGWCHEWHLVPLRGGQGSWDELGEVQSAVHPGSPQLCSGEGSAAVSCLKVRSNNVWGEPSRAGLFWGTARQVSGSWEGPEVSGPLTC